VIRVVVDGCPVDRTTASGRSSTDRHLSVWARANDGARKRERGTQRLV